MSDTGQSLGKSSRPSSSSDAMLSRGGDPTENPDKYVPECWRVADWYLEQPCAERAAELRKCAESWKERA